MPLAKQHQTTAYIGLGSNLDHPQQQVLQAITNIAQLPKMQLLKQSSLYQTKPYGPVPQADFINAVISIGTHYSPDQLLQALQHIEQQQGRVRTIRWGPRTIDLDILLFGNHTIDSSTLRIPHPELKKRNFVLYPLAEIEPSLILPNGMALEQLLTQVDQQGMIKIT